MPESTYVYGFDHEHPVPPMERKDLLGGKGANLAEMTSVLRLPVPPGFTITTEACRAALAGAWPEGLADEVAAHVAADGWAPATTRSWSACARARSSRCPG